MIIAAIRKRLSRPAIEREYQIALAEYQAAVQRHERRAEKFRRLRMATARLMED